MCTDSVWLSVFVVGQLRAEQAGEDPAEVSGVFGDRPLYKMLGYFSLVGLLRLHSLLGDYHEAIHALRHVQLNKKVIIFYYKLLINKY